MRTIFIKIEMYRKTGWLCPSANLDEFSPEKLYFFQNKISKH